MPTYTSALSTLEDSRNDLIEDYHRIQYFITNDLDSIRNFQVEISQKKLLIEMNESIANVLNHNLESLQMRLKSLKVDLKAVSHEDRLKISSNKFHQIFSEFRNIHNIIGAMLTSTDWQSPSFLSSGESQAGKQTGKILAHINDYKRDQHIDGNDYQKKFLHEYIDSFVKFPIHVYLTNSGMAAFSTILNFLLMEQKIKGPVLLGKSSYFECKELIKKHLKEKVIEFDETESNQLRTMIRDLRPSAIFIDSLTNDAKVTKPDLDSLLTFIKKEVRDDTYVVVDNTCQSIYFQPFGGLIAKSKHTHLIVHESLNKYHQFGLDRVTAGIIYAHGKDVEKLYFTREHCGTNISDTASVILPKPNRGILQMYLKRLERNTNYTVKFLTKEIQEHPTSILERLDYPSNAFHHLSFNGCFFTLVFKEQYRTTIIYDKLIKKIIATAKRHGVTMVSGTSFGLPTTRIYLTSLTSEFGEPFVRISLGAENSFEVEKICHVLSESILQF